MSAAEQLQSPTRDVGARLKAYVAPAGECQLWVRGKTWDGYGRISVGNVDRLAHVVSYEHQVGPVPAGTVLDHTCRNRACVNPAHLEPVPFAVNVRRGDRCNERSGKCRRGHDLPGGGRCPLCRRQRDRAKRQARRDWVGLAEELSR